MSSTLTQFQKLNSAAPKKRDQDDDAFEDFLLDRNPSVACSDNDPWFRKLLLKHGARAGSVTLLPTEEMQHWFARGQSRALNISGAGHGAGQHIENCRVVYLATNLKIAKVYGNYLTLYKHRGPVCRVYVEAMSVKDMGHDCNLWGDGFDAIYDGEYVTVRIQDIESEKWRTYVL